MPNLNVSQTEKDQVAVLILGGGRGTRLHPLTLKRSKPAVPFAGRYRLVDIALSRCIHARLLHLYVLTQYSSASLHLHINSTYRFDSFTKGHIRVLAANQTYMQNDYEQWFLGSADAVRKTLGYYCQGPNPYQHYLILAGDQIHEMDLEAMLSQHLHTNADFTIAGTPIAEEQLHQYGVLQVRADGKVGNFVEKPGPHNPILSEFRSQEHAGKPSDKSCHKPYWGSLGTYLIKAEILNDILRKEEFPDFGSGVLPYATEHYQTALYPHLGFFEDIGILETFFDVHIQLAESRLPINLYHPDTSLYTYRRELPPALFTGSSNIDKSLVVEGSVLGHNVGLESSLIGVRSIIQKNCRLRRVYLMGNDFYPHNIVDVINISSDDLEIGIGAHCQIENAIIDKNARIGHSCRIGLEPDQLQDGNYQGYCIRNGIVMIPKSSILPPHTVI